MATDWSFLGANPELVAALKSYEARRAQATIAPTSIPQVAGEAADEQGFLGDAWDAIKYGFKQIQTPLELPKYAISSTLGKEIDPEAYQRALIANAGEPLEDIDTQERIINAPGALGTLVEKFIPGEQEGWAKAGKTVATLAAEILGDPLTYVPVGGAGGMLYRGAKGIKTATKLAGAGKLAKAAKVGGMGTIRALASPAAGLAYAPDILRGVAGGAQEAWQEASEGNVSNALAAATQAGVVGILGGLLGKGAYGDVKGLRAARKALGTKGDPVQAVGTSEMDALRTEAKQILPPEIDIETMSRPDLEAALNQQKSIDADNAAKALAAQETEVAPEAFPDDIESFEPNLPQSLDAEGNPIEILPEEAPANTVDKWVDEQVEPVDYSTITELTPEQLKPPETPPAKINEPVEVGAEWEAKFRAVDEQAAAEKAALDAKKEKSPPKFQTKEVPITKTEDVGEVGDALGPVEVEAYHGTQSDIDKIDFDQTPFGMHFGTVEQANARIKEKTGISNIKGNNILPVKVKLNSPLRMKDIGHWESPRDVWDGLFAMGIKVTHPSEYDTNSIRFSKMREELQDLGYDGIVYKNEYEVSKVDKLRRFSKEPLVDAKDSYIVFDRKQVTSTLSPKHKFQTKPVAKTFYSKVVETLKGKKTPKAAHGDQWLQWLMKQPEVKADELKWTGLMEYFETNKGKKLTSKQVSDFMAKNEVILEETTKGNLSTEEEARLLNYEGRLSKEPFIVQNELGETLNSYKTREEANALIEELKLPDGGTRHLGSKQLSIMETGTSELTAKEYADFKNLFDRPGPKYANPSYELEGPKSNSREFLLRMPGKRIDPKLLEVAHEKVKLAFDEVDIIKKSLFDHPPGQTDAEADLVRSKYFKAQEKAELAGKELGQLQSADRGDRYTGGHFDEPGVLVHVRMNTRTDANGKKVAFVEEIQSDMHKAGRAARIEEIERLVEEANITDTDSQAYRDIVKSVPEDFGYSKEAPVATAAIEASRGYSKYFEIKDSVGRNLMRLYEDKFPSLPFTAEHAIELANQKIKEDPQAYTRGVPDAPFKGNYHELAFRRMVKLAADEGFDSIAWTTGKQQVARYENAFRKSVDEITWRRTAFKDLDTIVVQASKNGKITFDQPVPLKGKTDITGQKASLDDIVGKTLAKQIRESSESSGKFEGKDLTIGGEGMKLAYDQKLPQYANKFGKEFGAKVGETKLVDTVQRTAKEELDIIDALGKLPEDYYNTTVHSLDITPAMRATAVEKGVPLFAIQDKIPQFRSPEDLVKAAPKEMGGDWTVKDGEASATLGNGGKLIVKAVGQVSLDSDYKGQHGALPDGTKPAGSTQTVGLDTIIKLGPLADIGTLRHELKGHAAFALRLLDEDTQGVILKKYGSEEAFAQAVQTGKFEAPKGFWNKVKEAFTRLYRTLVGSQDGKATQKILDAYRAMPAEFKQAQRKNLPAQTPALTEYKARDFIDPPHDPTLKPIPELKLPEKKKAIPIPVEKLKAKPEASQAAKEAFEKTPVGEEKPKPDKKTSLNFETELEKLDIKGEDKQRFVAEMKALNSSMDRSKTQHMSEADMDMIMTNKFGEATPEFIRQRLETNEWDQADLRYFKRVLATARIDKINKHVKSANDPSNKGLKDAYEEAGVREEILALAVGNGKTYAGRLLRSLRTSDTALTPDHSFFDRFIQGLREEGLTERRIEFIKEAREEKGISFAMDVASKVANPGLLEKFVEWRTLGFLTGPATILAVNPLSNAFMRGMKDWEHAVLNVFHETKALITGKEPESYASEIGATLRSHVRTLFNKTGDMSTFGRGFMEIVTAKELSDRSVIFPGTKRSSKIEQRTRGWIGHTGSKPARIAGEYFKYGAKFLEVVDELAKSFAGNDARARLTHRKAKRSLREELKAGTRKKITAEDILQREIEFGKEIDDARQGILNEIERVDNYNKKLVRDVEGNIPPREKYDLDPKNWKNLGLKSQWGISTLKEMQTAADTDTFQLRMEKFGQGLENVKNSHPSIQLVVPFFRTPVNIVKEAIKRTPVVGVLFKSPGTSKQEAWVQTTTGALAASITLIVASGGSDDYFEVTGGGPQNARKNSNLRATGWQPYSFRVGDRYYDYSRLEPISSTIGIAADMYEAHKEGDLTTVKDKRNKMFASVQENFLNKTFLMGLEGLFGALEQPERRLDAYLRNFVGSVVPVGVKAFTRAYDPVIRKKESLVGDALKATLPGFSETLEPYRDSSGAPVKRIQPLNPIYTSTRKKTAVADVLREFDRIGYIPMSPRRANTNGIRLSNVQFAKLSDVRQDTLKEIEKRFLKSPRYMNLPPEYRKAKLKKFISNRERRIKQALFMQAARVQ